MPAAAHRPAPSAASASLAMPPFAAHGNGLRAVSWVPLAQIDEQNADTILLALADARVPACTAPAHRTHPDGVLLLWVDVPARTRAEDVLRALLPALPGQADHRARGQAGN